MFLCPRSLLMLEIITKESELYNEERNEFYTVPSVKLQLEHSLISISQWESKWCKSFLSTPDKSNEEIVDYIKCMTINKNVSSDVYLCLSQKNINDIVKYIEAPMTATTVYDAKKRPPSKQIITSELIYYWMIAYQIPFECQKWHLNRLLMLIRVCSVKNSDEKMDSKTAAQQRLALNKARRAKMNSRG